MAEEIEEKYIRADRRKYHYIYRIDRIDGSGKYYVGLHSTDDLLNDPYFGSGTILARSIKKHGKHMHNMRIMEFLPTRKLVKAREKEIVNKEMLADPLCMNLKEDGEGGWPEISKEERAKRALSAHRIMKAKNELANLYTGINDSAEIKEAYEWKNKRSKNIGDSISKSYENGTRIRPIEWNKHASLKAASPEANEKRRQTLLKNKSNIGEKNSQFGKRWVHKDKTDYKINESELNEYLNNGYLRGKYKNPKISRRSKNKGEQLLKLTLILAAEKEFLQPFLQRKLNGESLISIAKDYPKTRVTLSSRLKFFFSEELKQNM